LVYDNHKAARLRRRLPITADTAELIATWQHHRAQLPTAPATRQWLFPSPLLRSQQARGHLTASSIGVAFRVWTRSIPKIDGGLLGPEGTPLLFDRSLITPYVLRHSYAQRHADAGVPVDVLKELLEHESTQMTAHYARITDQTVRRRWEAATKVNIKGERVSIDPEGPLAQAQCAKTRYGMATQTLPNGYCGQPLQRTCPHANACLTCPVFLTGPEFLPELREQQQRTLTLIDVSERNGQARMVEMNQQVLTNLNRMIGEVEKAATEQETTYAG
jgi:Phage integrase family